MTPAGGAFTWRELLSSSPLSWSESMRMVEELTGRRGGEWVLVLDEPVGKAAQEAFASMVGRRLEGEPLQYVLGRWGFRGLDLEVGPDVLVPRPETEFVVEVAKECIGAGQPPGTKPRSGCGGMRPVVVDLGTGTGAIALSLAVECGVEVWATDVSPGALRVARRNRDSLGLRQSVHLLCGKWYEPLPAALAGRVSLVVSNPPYIASGELASLPEEVRLFEPTVALVSGPTGLEAVSAVVRGAGRWLAPGGWLVVEVAPHQAAAALELAREVGLEEAETRQDLAGRDRCLVARRSQQSGKTIAAWLHDDRNEVERPQLPGCTTAATRLETHHGAS